MTRLFKQRPARRYWRDRRAAAIWLPALVFITWRWLAFAGNSGTAEVPQEGDYGVVRVEPGGEFVLPLGAVVRLPAIDIPEPIRGEAIKFAEGFVQENGGRVRLTFGMERQDESGRWLAFVQHGDFTLNEELLRGGLARARLDFRSSGRMKSRLAAAQDEARKAGRGIWSAAGADLQ